MDAGHGEAPSHYEGHQQHEDEYAAYIKKEEAGDPKTIGILLGQATPFYEEMRRAANHNDLVSLVTRLEHWTRKFAKQLSLSTNKSKPPVAPDMEALNNRLGGAPVSVQFFEELVTARDSVIHADSQATWEYQGKTRRVAAKYVNEDGELGFTEEHLFEAVEKTTAQVNWYDDPDYPLHSDCGFSSREKIRAVIARAEDESSPSDRCGAAPR